MNIKYYNLFIPILFVMGCSQNNNNIDSFSGNSIVANYNGGTINVIDMDEYIKKLQPEQRWNYKSPENWYKNLIQKLILEKILLKEAKDNGVENSSKYILNSRHIDRETYSNQYFKSHPYINNINEKELKLYYDQHPEKYFLPEKREVYHIYKSGNNQNTYSSLISIRKRIIDGENFLTLAMNLSDSETRHDKGYLGSFTHDSKLKMLTKEIFKLEKNIPSKPIKIGGGYHLFLVTEILKQSNIPFIEVKNSIFRILSNMRKHNHLKEAALALQPLPANFYIVSKNELDKTIKSNNGSKELLRIGKFTLNYYQLKNELITQGRQSGLLTSNSITINVLENIAYKELILQSESINPSDVINNTILKNKLLLRVYKDLKEQIYLDNNPDIITDYFNKNKKRFYSAIKMEIQVLRIPKNTTENLMPMLENSFVKLKNDNLSFEDLAKSLDAHIETLGLLSAFQIKKYGRQLSHFALKLETGDFSPPYTTNKHYNIIKLVNRLESKPQQLEDIKDKVVEYYLRKNNLNVVNNLNQIMLKNLKFNNQNIDKFLANPIGF